MIATVTGKQYLSGNKQNIAKWNSTSNSTYYEMGFRGTTINEDFICASTSARSRYTCIPQLGACNQQDGSTDMW